MKTLKLLLYSLLISSLLITLVTKMMMKHQLTKDRYWLSILNQVVLLMEKTM